MTYSATTPYLPDTDCIIYAQLLIPPKNQGTHNQLRDTAPIIAPKLYSEVVAFTLIVKAYNKKKVAFGKTKTKTMNIITSMIALKPSSFVLRSTAYLLGGLSHETKNHHYLVTANLQSTGQSLMVAVFKLIVQRFGSIIRERVCPLLRGVNQINQFQFHATPKSDPSYVALNCLFVRRVEP